MIKRFLTLTLIATCSLVYSQNKMSKVNLSELIIKDPNIEKRDTILKNYSDSLYSSLYQDPRFNELRKRCSEIDTTTQYAQYEINECYSKIRKLTRRIDLTVEQKRNELIFNQDLNSFLDSLIVKNGYSVVFVCDAMGELLGVIHKTSEFESKLISDEKEYKAKIVESYKNKTGSKGGAIDYKQMALEAERTDYTEFVLKDYLNSAFDLTKIIVEDFYTQQ